MGKFIKKIIKRLLCEHESMAVIQKHTTLDIDDKLVQYIMWNKCVNCGYKSKWVYKKWYEKN